MLSHIAPKGHVVSLPCLQKEEQEQREGIMFKLANFHASFCTYLDCLRMMAKLRTAAGFQAKISKFCLSKEHSPLRPFSVNVDPMATVLLVKCNSSTYFYSRLSGPVAYGLSTEFTSEDAQPSIYTMHKMSAHFDFDDHWALRPVFFLQRWKGHCRLRRETLGNPGLGHSFPRLDH
ncbi:hypothetical protein Tco_1292415 [Tanacetum coccineum]